MKFKKQNIVCYGMRGIHTHVIILGSLALFQVCTIPTHNSNERFIKKQESEFYNSSQPTAATTAREKQITILCHENNYFLIHIYPSLN